MKIKFLITLLITLLITSSAFANLPYRKIQWPSDDKTHFDEPQVKTEWWHYTGKLTAENSDQIKQFFYYITLRYERDASGGVPTVDVLIADMDSQKVYDNSIPLKDAHLILGDLNITSQNFGLESKGGKYSLRLTIPAQGTLLDLSLSLTPLKKALLIGEANTSHRGLINMGDNTNSFYYSVTRLQTEGFIQVGNDKFVIEADSSLSRSWMDHQWGDFSLTQKRKPKAWIWIGAQLKDGRDISVKEIIEPTTDKLIQKKIFASISLKNSSSQYKPASIRSGKISGGGYPAYYTLKVSDVSYHLVPVVPHLNKDAIWVGILKVDGQSVKAPDASFAIVENMLPHL